MLLALSAQPEQDDLRCVAYVANGLKRNSVPDVSLLSALAFGDGEKLSTGPMCVCAESLEFSADGQLLAALVRLGAPLDSRVLLVHELRVAREALPRAARRHAPAAARELARGSRRRRSPERALPEYWRWRWRAQGALGLRLGFELRVARAARRDGGLDGAGGRRAIRARDAPRARLRAAAALPLLAGLCRAARQTGCHMHFRFLLLFRLHLHLQLQLLECLQLFPFSP